MVSKLASGTYEFELPTKNKIDAQTTDKDKLFHLDIKINDVSVDSIQNTPERRKCEFNAKDKDEFGNRFDGFCVYEPSPVKISIYCGNALIAGPKVVNLYETAYIVNPKRNFLTNPHATYTMTNGILTGVKYEAQSPIKGAFDVVLSPIKAVLSALPTSQTSTQVQTGGGKPKQTTIQNTIIPSK